MLTSYAAENYFKWTAAEIIVFVWVNCMTNGAWINTLRDTIYLCMIDKRFKHIIWLSMNCQNNEINRTC